MRILRTAAVLIGAAISFSSVAMAAERGVVPLNEFLASIAGAQSVPKVKGAAAAASTGWVKFASYNLYEYSQYPRKGSYDLYYNMQATNPYHFYPIYAVVNIGAVCDPPRVVLYGGLEGGWVSGYTTDPTWIHQYDPQADRALGVVFDAARNDGSSGTTLECGGTSPDKGSHVLFLYPTQNQYRDQLGLEVGDFFISETNRFGSGINRWYHVYQ
jgi:hypothetical protein